MNKQSGPDQKDLDVFSVLNNTYNHIFMKEII